MPRKQPNSGSQISTRGTNGPRVKKLNEALVLDLVRRLGPVARPTIASRLGLEFQTVSNICARLIDRGLLLEDGVVDGPHRQSRAVVVNPLAVYSLGVELNREYANAVLISFDGTVHGRRDVLVGDREPADVLDEAADKLGELTHDSGIDDTRIAGIGLSVPGPIDYRSGTILAPINFNAWHGVGVQAELEHRTGRQIWLENTATSAALGEQWTGVGSDTDDFLYIYLGAGVGVGVIAGGRSLHGAYGNAGEFAHLVVDPLGPECPCGQRGCLVQYATPAACSTSCSALGWKKSTAIRDLARRCLRTWPTSCDRARPIGCVTQPISDLGQWVVRSLA